MTPGKCKLEELNEKVEQWMELLNRYEARRGTGGQRESLPDDTKMSILESMCPLEIERHLQVSRPRFMDFGDLHSELATYLKTRVGLKLKIENLGSTGKKDADAMDVGVLSKGKPKGKGKGKYIGAFSKGKAKATRMVKVNEERKVMEKVTMRPRVDQVRRPQFAPTAGSRDISKRIASWPKAKERANHPTVERKA